MSPPRLAMVVLLAALLWPMSAAAQTVEPTLSAVGRGKVELRPDGGRFVVAVTLTAPAANKARRQATARFSAVVRALKAVGVERGQLTTQQISVSRDRRRRREGKPARVRFRAFVLAEVEVQGLKPLARAIDAATRGGATDVYGPDLTVSEEVRRGGKTRAEAGALVDARARADAAAAATGQQIVGVQSIDLDPGSDGFDPTSLESAGASFGGRPLERTRIFAARQTFTSRVRVTYVIEPTT